MIGLLFDDLLIIFVLIITIIAVVPGFISPVELDGGIGDDFQMRSTALAIGLEPYAWSVLELYFGVTFWTKTRGHISPPIIG